MQRCGEVAGRSCRVELVRGEGYAGAYDSISFLSSTPVSPWICSQPRDYRHKVVSCHSEFETRTYVEDDRSYS